MTSLLSPPTVDEAVNGYFELDFTGGGETLHQRPFLNATLLDTSKREERPPCCLRNEPRSAGQVNRRG